jgi:hypothetical protein
MNADTRRLVRARAGAFFKACTANECVPSNSLGPRFRPCLIATHLAKRGRALLASIPTRDTLSRRVNDRHRAGGASSGQLHPWGSCPSSTSIHLPCNALKNARRHLIVRQNRPQIPRKSRKSSLPAARLGTKSIARSAVAEKLMALSNSIQGEAGLLSHPTPLLTNA